MLAHLQALFHLEVQDRPHRLLHSRQEKIFLFHQNRLHRRHIQRYLRLVVLRSLWVRVFAFR